MLIGQNVNKMRLTNLTTGAPLSINFYGVLPESVQESHATNFEPLSIKSRSNPLVSYSGSGTRSTSISVLLHEDYIAEFEGGAADIRRTVAKIKSLTYPQYENLRVLPPRVLLRIGDFFKIYGYCSDCQVTWKLPIRNDRYIVAEVSFTIQEALKQSFTMAEVWNMSDMARIY